MTELDRRSLPGKTARALARIAGALERAADALETLARLAEEKREGESLEAATAAYDTKKR